MYAKWSNLHAITKFFVNNFLDTLTKVHDSLIQSVERTQIIKLSMKYNNIKLYEKLCPIDLAYSFTT